MVAQYINLYQLKKTQDPQVKNVQTKHTFVEISAIYEGNNFISRKALTLINRSKVKSRRRKPVTENWILKSTEDPEKLICSKSINAVKGYAQVPVVDYK